MSNNTIALLVACWALIVVVWWQAWQLRKMTRLLNLSTALLNEIITLEMQAREKDSDA